jgi:hypothetical protein
MVDVKQAANQQPAQPQPEPPKEPKLMVDCQPIAQERNHYFTGKLMTARDFTAETEYFLSHSRAHNRLLHGWGIVCGLEVVPHKNPTCRDRWVVIQPGIALDCCGRELVVRESLNVELPLPPEAIPASRTSAPSTSPCGDGLTPPAASTLPLPFLVVLSYDEQEVEFVPALYAEGCEPNHKEANRIRETVKVGFKLPEELPGCWKQVGGDDKAPCYDCDETDDCLEAPCACGSYIPVAMIRYKNPEKPEEGWVIDPTGRRDVGDTPNRLTRIIDINWNHGKPTPLEQLRYGEGYAFVITFNREILDMERDDDDANNLKLNVNGISPYTFTVELIGSDRDVQYLNDPDKILDDGRVYLSDDKYYAVYMIDTEELSGQRNILEKYALYITLKCDFILDCHGRAVDGNHLRGRLPSGDGTEGGTFESWTSIKGEPLDNDRRLPPASARDKAR